MNEIVQQIRLSVVETPTAPNTGVAGTNSTGLIIALTIIALTIVIAAIFLFLRRNKTSGRIILPLIAITLATAGMATTLVQANTSLNLNSEPLNITIVKPNLSATASSTLSVTTDTVAHNLSATLNGALDALITIKVNGETLSDLPTTLATDSTNTSYTLDYSISINGSLPVGNYTTYVSYNVEEIPDPLPAPSSEFTTKTSNIVPNFASTIAPSGNGTGTNGPQFSIYGSGFGSSPTVTIGGQPCTDVVVNSAGTAITCTGPVSGMTNGEHRTFINGSDAGNNYTVWYTSFNFPTLQSLTTTGSCLGTPTTPVIYRDSRDSQLYYVAKLADNKCWMLDNLRYKPNGDTTGTVTSGFSATQVANTGTFLTNNGNNTPNNTSNIDTPLYIDPITVAYCYNNTNKSPQNITKCGFLYNLYTANAGTVDYTIATGGTQSTGSICPLNWHLPTATSTTSGPGNGTSYNYADFAVLNASMNAGTFTTPGVTTQTTGFYENWQYNGPWRGVFSGFYGGAFLDQGAYGSYWSSSVHSAAYGRYFYFNSSLVSPGNSSNNRYYGSAVRCVL
ncbi:hypothetical protein FWC31_00965 [Candidatus Saccharibacteria bacterium]|nr:hypothetical protein [Candidatus Saccharibacteria bacterium]